MNENEKYLKVAVAAAKQSGKIFQKYFGRPQSVKMKDRDPANLVTEIDKAIEAQIRKILLKNFPNHKIIGEELGRQKLKKTDLVWIIDPVDGTTNYIQGLPFCCISIALWDSQGPMVAAIYNPLLKKLFTATRGKGAKLNNKTIGISKEKNLGHAFGSIGLVNDAKGIPTFTLLAKNVRKLRTLATAALQMSFVASGNFDFFTTTSIKIWDFAAAALIVAEAGGTVTDMQGKPLTINTKNVLASNGKIHSQLLKLLK